MKRNHLLCLIGFLALPLLVRSQTVSGSILYDNPDKLKPTFFIHPWYLNTWKPNPNSGLIFGFRIPAGKMVDFDLDLQLSYKNRHRTDADLTTFPPFNREEFRLCINGDISRETRGLRTRYTTNMDVVPFITRRMCMTIRFGFNHTGSTVQGADVNSKLVSYATQDTSAYNGRIFYSTYNVVIGFSIKSIFNAVITAEGRRISTGKYMEFYGDAIINVAYNIHDIDMGTDSGYVIPQGRTPFGVRMGCQFYDPSKPNFTFGVEFGSQPGLKYNYKPSYFLFKVGLSITGKAKID